jgi:N-acetylglucosamine-6-phosphate deacetylase
MIVLRAQLLYTPQEEIEHPLVFIEDGIISELSSRTQRDIPTNATEIDLSHEFPGAILAPGFVDIHMHGGAGLDVMSASAAELPHLNRFLTKHGVTGYFPTTVAAALDPTCAALGRLADAIETVPGTNGGVQAQPLGIHLEGPFLSHKRRGVHPPENLIAPTLEIFERLWQAARGHIRMMTIAPELPGAIDVIAEAARRQVCVSIGHSDAMAETARAAVHAGARHATHTFNAMRPLDHRDPGILAEVLTDEQLTADIIADGIHVAPEVVRLFLNAKGKTGSVLITDATAATGMPDGTYQLGPILVEVKDGRCMMDGKLAGSVLTMDRAVRNITRFGGWSLRDAVRAATLNPSLAVGLKQIGVIAPGADANIVLLSPKGEVCRIFVRGHAA